MKKNSFENRFIYRNRRRIAVCSLWGLLFGSVLAYSAPLSDAPGRSLAESVIAVPDPSATPGESATPTDDPQTRPYNEDGSETAEPTADPAASGQAASVTHEYNKKVSYSKIRKKLKSKRSFTYLFEDTSKTSSRLTLFGFFYKTWNLPHTGYGDMNENITLYPVIRASKNGSSSTLSFGIRLESYIQILNPTSRKYKKMIISGGGEKIALSGSTTTRMKIVGQFVKRKYMTTGTFTLSSNKNPHIDRIEKLNRILEAGNTKIKVKDYKKNKTYTCKINKIKSINLTDFTKKYMSVLKKYQSK